MRKHIFTLGLLLSSFCIMPIMADDWVWNGPTKETTQGMYKDKARKTLATEHCSDCCTNTCWLPNGTYYNENGTKIIHTCSTEPPAPTCNSKMTYPSGKGECSGCYSLKSNWCLKPTTDGVDRGYVAPNGEGGLAIENINLITGSGATPSVSELRTRFLMHWAVQFDGNDDHIIKGKAACSTKNSISTDDSVYNDPDGTYCWCQMTSPKETNWVYLTILTSCQRDCPMLCAERIQENQKVREKLLNNIQDDTQQ
ncbi:MAG: hypothetical protein MJ170_03710 [Alphaproteobacteria bacterium]|nr:hypothetical protein [Alphaproteobacteria bacterium]